MSMPTIPEERHRPTKNEVIIDLLKSIAMEETALAHLINAEAKKVKAFVGPKGNFPLSPSVKQIIAFNAHVFKIMDVIVMKEWLLLRKLNDVADLAPWECDDEGPDDWNGRGEE